MRKWLRWYRATWLWAILIVPAALIVHVATGWSAWVPLVIFAGYLAIKLKR